LGTADITRIITAGEPFDILVGTTALADQAVAANRVVANTRVPAGRVGIGIVVRSGSPLPAISTPDAVRQAALSADGVVYNTAGSGQAVQRMFESMGIAGQIQLKAARPGNAAQTMDRILKGKGVEIGFGLLSEIKPYEAKGIRLVGPLPAAVQSYTNYEAVISAASTLSDAARNFLRYIATPSAKQVFAATGVD
jgi:molybdate transport system substrate-binding protein